VRSVVLEERARGLEVSGGEMGMNGWRLGRISAGKSERGGGIKPLVEITREGIAPRRAEPAEEGGEGDFFFAEPDAGMRGFERVAGAGEFIQGMRGLDVDHLVTGAGGILHELAKTYFGGVGNEGEHRFRDIGAGETDADEGTGELVRGVCVPGFNGLQKADVVEVVVDADDFRTDPGARFNAWVCEVSDDFRQSGVVADDEAGTRALGDFFGTGDSFGSDRKNGAHMNALPVEAAFKIVEGEIAGNVSREDLQRGDVGAVAHEGIV
jgi:hypothetical protein